MSKPTSRLSLMALANQLNTCFYQAVHFCVYCFFLFFIITINMGNVMPLWLAQRLHAYRVIPS